MYLFFAAQPVSAFHLADDGNDLALGFGARWNMTETLGFRAEADWFDIDEADSVWMASIGFELRF